MTSPPLDFLHIGLGKCASTYLYNVFKYEPAYEMVDIGKIMMIARDLARSEREEVAPIQFPDVPKQAKYRMASSEGFTFAFLDEPKYQDRMHKLHRVSASFIDQSRLTNKILLVVRDPSAWIKSAYAQHINQGGYITFTEFYEQYNDLIKQSLDIKHILSEFGRNCDVAIVNSDDLKEKPAIFWKQLGERLGVDSPTKQAIRRIPKDVNKSLKPEQVALLASLNRVSAMQFQELQSSESYRKAMPRECDDLLKSVNASWKWGNRRFVEHGDSEALSKAKGLLSLDDVYAEMAIDSGMTSHIRKNFLEPLEEQSAVSSELLDRYELNLSNSKHGIVLSSNEVVA